MDDLPNVVPYVATTIIAISTIPTLWRIASIIRHGKIVKDHGIYEDKDGTATEESMAQYSTKKSFVVIFIGVALGLAASFALAVAGMVYHMDGVTRIWLLFGSWVLALVQVFDTFREPQIVLRSQRGVTCSISFVFIAVAAAFVISTLNPSHSQNIAFFVTLGVQICSAVATATTLGLIQRRPDVFTPDGKIVERQFTSSLLTRYSYNWSSDLLDVAAEKLIEPEDLPAMDSHVRAADVKESFQSIMLKPTVALWVQIFWRYWGQITFQWALVFVSTIIDAGPQFAMFQLLQYLEARQESGVIDPKAWLCVGSLFVATIAETLVDYRVGWLMWSEIGIPIRASVTTLIFEKMMKIKDCKEPPKAEEEALNDDSKKANRHGKAVDATEDAKKEAEKKKADRSQQDIINMFAVDANQVGVFGAINQFYVMFASKFIVSAVFLWLLVGWQSLGAGMIAIALVFPLNKLLASRYGSYQKQLMKARDAKTKVVSEALSGIRQIKFSAVETEWTEKIETVRENELKLLWKTKLNSIYMTICGDIAPVFLTVFALATYAYIHGDLLPSVAFTALGVFMQLEGILGMVPFLFMMGINAKVSCDRIDTFLRSAEKPENTYPGDSISFENVSVSFPTKSSTPEKGEAGEDEDEEAREARNNRFVLRDLTLKFPNGSLSVILGPTGSGKSLLLAAILGEVDVLQGSITVPRAPPVDQRFDSKATAADWIIPSSAAYVAQTPWIENATIKDNLLFGLPFDESRYNKVLKACALTDDLAILDDGDMTEVGAQGITLSGGQKWRLTLARALYSRAGILILDDVFSALDAHVGKQIYDNALMGELAQGRTCILATHHVALCLPGAEYAVCLSATGTLEHAGLVKDLRQIADFEDILKARNDEGKQVQIQPTDEEVPNGHADGPIKSDKPTPKKLIEDEKRETGSVKKGVYITYLKATGGFPFWTTVFMFYVVAQALTLGRSWWIKIWTSSYEHVDELVPAVYAYAAQTHFTRLNASISARSMAVGGFATLQGLLPALLSSQSPSTIPNMDFSAKSAPSVTSNTYSVYSADTPQTASVAFPINVNNRTIGFYLLGYILISVVSTIIDVGRYYAVYRGSLTASRKVFREMTYRVLRTPLRWLDTVPTGRILNRFTADFQAVDSQLSSNFAQVASSFLSIAGIMAAAFIVSPYIIILACLLLAICGRIALRYIRGARSIKRLESIQKSPMISHFTASLQGLSTVRAFANVEVFEKRMHNLIDSYTTATWHNWLFNNWVSFRMAMIGSVFSTLVAAFVVSTPGIDASLGGFALAFALSFRQTVNRTLRQLAATELDMNAAERVFEYSNLEVEEQGGVDVRASWPEKGELDIKDLEVSYAEGLPLILKGLNLHAEMNERIGVVGRTGAGKSTLSLALFRFLKASAGSITIDGIDISTIKLHDLRTRLAIIPQDPVLFSGTIRSNLDPFDEFTDVQLRQALERVHLIPSSNNTPVPELESPATSSAEATSSATSTTAADSNPAVKENTNIFLSLSSPISSSGANLSQGQKQLLCLARAILSRPKVLLLDEATSAVDKKTDTLIQRSIREEFANTTLLVIAHRLSTVMDFDKILVMKEGRAAEFGTPRELLALDGGVFKGMVGQSGEKEELERTVEGGL